MKAILCQRFGTPDDLVLADIADPVAGPGEVVARVMTVGLNFFDTLIIAGKYQTKPPFPFSPGLNAVTPAPTLSTTPANSPPGENGNGGLV